MKPFNLLANKLNNCQYRNEMTKEDIKFAKDNNLLVIYGASDDIIMLDGIISDEIYTDTYFLNNKKYINDEQLEIINSVAFDYIGDIKKLIDIKFKLTHSYSNDGWKFDININKNPVFYQKFYVLENTDLYGEGIVIQF